MVKFSPLALSIAKTPFRRCHVNVFFDFEAPGNYDSDAFGGLYPLSGDQAKMDGRETWRCRNPDPG
jgi:hypothetical protein